MIVVRRVVGSSMKPALFEGDIVIGVRYKRPKVGDIVIAKQRGREVIKRVDVIKKKKVYLVGDNKRHSSDSRHYGPVTQKSVLAVALFAVSTSFFKRRWLKSLALLVVLAIPLVGFVSWAVASKTEPSKPVQQAINNPIKTEITPKYPIAAVVPDLPYCNDQQLDIYYPTKVVFERAPVVVFLHGGGWEVNDRKSEVTVMNDFVGSLREKGFALVSIDYRKLPEYSYPSPVQDALCSVRYLRAEQQKLGIDPERIGMFGFSSGGHLAAMTGVLDSNNELAQGQLYSEQSSRVKAVVVLAGLLDFSDGLRNNNILRLRYFLKQADWQSASPATYVSKDDPSFLLVHGMKDQFIDPAQDELFARRLRENQVPVDVVHVENANHFLNPDGGEMNISREEIAKKISDFLQKTL